MCLVKLGAGFPGGSGVKNLAANTGDMGLVLGGEDPLEEDMATYLPGESHGQRSLAGYSPQGCEELDTTERLHFHFSLSCIGEGNGNPIQYFCLENPRDRGDWWAAVHGVAQSRTRLKRLSSSMAKPIQYCKVISLQLK